MLLFDHTVFDRRSARLTPTPAPIAPPPPPERRSPRLSRLGQTLITLAILPAIALPAAVRAQEPSPSVTVERLEQVWEGQYEDYYQRDLPSTVQDPESIAAILRAQAARTGQRAAVIYAMPEPYGLELRLVTADGLAAAKLVPEATDAAIQPTVIQLRASITNQLDRRLDRPSYIAPARQLYDWLMAPLAAEIAAADVDLLIFCTGPGLRTVPLAALYDGEQFLIERYAIALIPGFSLLDTQAQDLRDRQVLAMGASEFEALEPLPGVQPEIASIFNRPLPDLPIGSPIVGSGAGWSGQAFLNEAFTFETLIQMYQTGQFGIVHLATHADFRTGSPANSFIQLWGDQLTLDRFAQWNFRDPAIELLVLSACRTAVGDSQAEMGFAGLAVNAGVRSAMASLWSVSDRGTLALMNDFYRQLQIQTTRAEALRQAQLALLQETVTINGDQMIRSGDSTTNITLPPSLQIQGSESLAHPFYWSAFLTIGNPW
jgi:CHAT domain-containing protein